MFPLPTATAAIIDDARRRQHRRRRSTAIGAACLAVIAGVAVFVSGQFRTPSHTASSTLARSTNTTYTNVTAPQGGGITIRGVGAGRQITVVPNVKLRSKSDSVTAEVGVNPQTGALEVRLVKRQKRYGAPTMTVR